MNDEKEITIKLQAEIDRIKLINKYVDYLEDEILHTSLTIIKRNPETTIENAVAGAMCEWDC